MEDAPYFVNVTRAALPLLITQVSSNEGDLAIGGDDWNLSCDSAWRVASEEGFMFGSRSQPTEQEVSSLIGRTVQKVEPSGFGNLDFRLYLDDKRVLEIFTDTGYEPWILRLPGVPLIVADGSRA